MKGLPYLTIQLFTDAEWENLPHVILTSDGDWDPDVDDQDAPFTAIMAIIDPNDIIGRTYPLTPKKRVN